MSQKLVWLALVFLLTLDQKINHFEVFRMCFLHMAHFVMDGRYGTISEMIIMLHY